MAKSSGGTRGASGGGGLGRNFYSQLASRVGSGSGEFIVKSPSGRNYDYTNFELDVIGSKGSATLLFSNADNANKVLKTLQQKGWKSAKGFPVYKYGDSDDNRKYLNSKKGRY